VSNDNDTSKRERIERSAGITPAERYLKELCDSSFLSLWSYPSIYRDQKSGKSGEGKEVADLLVVFGRDILVFSDKYCAFPNTKDINLDWKRWFRRAVENSAKQAWGAERWIKEHPDRLFVDRACTQRFPLKIAQPAEARFHLVIIAHDVSRRCVESLGGSGSLMVRNDLKGLKAHTFPFSIGDLDPHKSFVHVLDDTTLNIVLRTLDTVSDFTAYLTKKEALLRSDKIILAAGEEELLAFYLGKLNSDDVHDFVFPKESNSIILSEGHWEEFQKSTQREAQIKANEPSYVWDTLIERFSGYALSGEQFYASPSDFDSSETILRFLAREPRTRRRTLGRALRQIVEITSAEKRAIRVVQPSFSGDPYYIFLVFPFFDKQSYEDNRKVRRKFLQACCQVIKLRFPEAKDIIGIATESGFKRDDRSEDAVYLDAREWTPALNEQAKVTQQELGILINLRETRFTEQEYPEPSIEKRLRLPANPRNKLCPCGSGQKYKRCHGR
jgi:hypothetical protein